MAVTQVAEFERATIHRRRAALLGLLLTCVLVRVLLWLVYEPITYADTGTYTRLALQLQSMNFTDYTGWRTPGYPLLLLAGGMDFQRVWLLQTVLGITVSLMLYSLTLDYSGSIGLAFAVGLAQTLCLNQLFFEASIATETFSTFTVVLSVYLIVRTLAMSRLLLAWVSVLGLVLALAALTRPGYIYLGPLCWLLCVLRFAADIFGPGGRLDTVQQGQTRLSQRAAAGGVQPV
jgi:hypothetical protein